MIGDGVFPVTSRVLLTAGQSELGLSRCLPSSRRDIKAPTSVRVAQHTGTLSRVCVVHPPRGHGTK